MVRILYVLISFMVTGCYAASYPVMVGNETVIIKVWQGDGEKAFVHLHQNESTALKAAKAVLKDQRASLLTLQHSGGRTIRFELNKQQYEFDPNRIFSDRGIKRTLSNYSHYTRHAHHEVKKLAQQILIHLPRGKVIAVHNNNGYSIRDYLNGHSLAEDAQAIYLSPHRYFRNFFLVTQYNDFLRLKKSDFNGILQSEKINDDGSLSVLFANQPYVNVEAGYNQLAEQIKMLALA